MSDEAIGEGSGGYRLYLAYRIYNNVNLDNQTQPINLSIIYSGKLNEPMTKIQIVSLQYVTFTIQYLILRVFHFSGKNR